ncbi:hypothetical protein TNCV_4385411 [Trichonephila clavipes]|nr:hypothetical protein TNCV_4385411 [Trichonephila clavipes]
MASIEPWYSRRSTAFETHTVKPELNSLFIYYTTGTVIQLGVCPIASFFSTIIYSKYTLDTFDFDNPSCLTISETQWPMRHAPTWIPSHVNIAGNEIADSLARAGAGETSTPAAPFTYLEQLQRFLSAMGQDRATLKRPKGRRLSITALEIKIHFLS